MEDNDTDNKSKTRKWLIIGGFILIVVLIIAGLILPPISLGQRLGLGGIPEEEVAAAPETGLEEAAESASEIVIPDGLALSLSEGSAEIGIISQDDFQVDHPDAVTPDQMTMVSDVYT